jgi:hypothetical protein
VGCRPRREADEDVMQHSDPNADDIAQCVFSPSQVVEVRYDGDWIFTITSKLRNIWK